MDTKPAETLRSVVQPTATLKRNWYSRESIMDIMRGLGLPAMLDASHVVMTGMDDLARWLVASSDSNIAMALGGTSKKFGQALATFQAGAGALSITHVMSPGLSFRGMRPTLDGAAMRVRLATNNANEGPEGFIIPVSKEMLDNGAEWTYHVALVPKAHIGDWMAMMAAAQKADRMLDLSRLTLRCYNGPDVQIQPMALDDIIMDDTIRASFVDDVLGFLSRRDWYAERRLPWSRKYLLNGPPGTGKTSLARWAASTLNMPAITFDFTDSWADGRSFTGFMSMAQRMSPSIVILDDIDKVLGDGGKQNKTGITMHTMLTSFSGMGSTDGVMVIATSNSTEAFRGPMRRRFDSIIEVPLPAPDKRQIYLERLFAKDSVDPKDIKNIVEKSNGWSFDDLRALATASANFVIKRGGDTISGSDIDKGLKLIQERRNEE